MQTSISRESSKIYQSLLGAKRIYKEEHLNYFYYYCFMMIEKRNYEECLCRGTSFKNRHSHCSKNERKFKKNHINNKPIPGPEFRRLVHSLHLNGIRPLGTYGVILYFENPYKIVTNYQTVQTNMD